MNNIEKKLKATLGATVAMVTMGASNAFGQSSLPSTQLPDTIKKLVTQVTEPGIGRYGELTQAGASVVYKCGLVKVFQDADNFGNQKTLYSSAHIPDDRNLNVFGIDTLGSDYALENIIDAQDVLASSGVSMKHFISGGVTPSTVDTFELRLANKCPERSGGGGKVNPDVPGPGEPPVFDGDGDCACAPSFGGAGATFGSYNKEAIELVTRRLGMPDFKIG